MVKRLMTASDILRVIPAARSANLSILNRDSTSVEIDEFSSVLNSDFYELLKTKAIDWSNVKSFQEGRVYAIGDLVEHEFIVYESLSNSNSAMIVDSTKWKESKKFDGDIYNSLWDAGMSTWLANSIWSSVLEFQTYQMGGKGAVKHFDDSGERTVNEREFYSLKRTIDASIARGKRIMLAFISANKTALQYSDETQNAVIEEDNNRIGFLY